jgi:hypothetical protein
MKRSGASEAGFHFLELFKTCKRKWMIRYILGIEADRKPFQLIFGGCFHHGKAIFYETKSLSKAISSYKQAVKESRSELEDPSRYLPMMLERGPVMLEKWSKLLGKNDLRIYKILAIEKVIKFKLPNGYIFTIKPDVVVEASAGVYLFDTKTSWYSANLQSEQLEVGDQTSAYLYGWNLMHPKNKASGLVPDCIAWNLNSNDPDKIECTRSRLVTRSERELKEWADGTMSDLVDMASRVRGLRNFSEAQTFPRTTSYCLSYNRICEYADICRHKIEGIPGGFHENNWPGREALLKVKK